MNKEDLGKQTSVKIGAIIIGFHTVEPAVMITLESDPDRALIVSNKYVNEGLDPESLKEDKDMLERSFHDAEHWEMIEGADNPFKTKEPEPDDKEKV